jgi:hypothetical protein
LIKSDNKTTPLQTLPIAGLRLGGAIAVSEFTSFTDRQQSYNSSKNTKGARPSFFVFKINLFHKIRKIFISELLTIILKKIVVKSHKKYACYAEMF